MSKLRIAIAADHAGFKLKEDLIKYLENKKYIVKDFGTYSDESVDYPDFGHILAEAVLRERYLKSLKSKQAIEKLISN